MRHAIGLVAALALTLTAPAAERVSQPKSATSGRAPPQRIPSPVTETTIPPGEPMNIASVPVAVRRAVVADAARRFQVAESAVVLARAERVTWPDGSLGCPEPGRTYAQAQVPGYRLSARSAQGAFMYHADARGNLAICTPRNSKLRVEY